MQNVRRHPPGGGKGRPARLRRLRRWAPLAGWVALLPAPPSRAEARVPLGVWLIDEKAAVQIFDCSGMLCGRIAWLSKPRNAEGLPARDKHNPNRALRERGLCSFTMIWNLKPAGLDRWREGWFYNPDDGKTYRLSAELQSDDVLVARIYVGLPIFGKTKTLVRIPQGESDGWC